ncbi:MAG: hypothetical protein M0R32_11115 [Candidatus Cloacimonetes bacterium]|jgi:hypothetical protein|nr:hypothetical protein [Candidatus Cloacimonadota bacterium]
MKLIPAACTTFIILLVFVVSIIDAVQFHSIQRGSYETPWYDARWWKNPYTILRVFMAESNEHWTKNAVGDDWYVRETVINEKEWWTVLKKVEKNHEPERP